MNRTRIEAHAKINLSLEVFGLRPDGYHELRSVVAPIALADGLELTESDETTSDSGYPDDLAVKAVRVLSRSCGVSRGVRIHMDKHIPAGGGLGGGSADAAAVMRALNRLWDLRLPLAELAALAAEVGSDVPALVLAQEMRQPVLMEGRGERVSFLEEGADFPALPLVLVNPRVFSSTQKVFKNCLFRVTNDPEIVYNIRQSWRTGRFDALCGACMNDLSESAMRLEPSIRAACDALAATGARIALMTGSGATVFGLTESVDMARTLAARLTSAGFWACATHTIVR